MAKVAKKTTRTRRRDRKNIEKARLISVQLSTIQQLQLQIQLVMLYLGQVPAVQASAAQERAHLSLLKQLQKQQLRQLWNME